MARECVVALGLTLVLYADAVCHRGHTSLVRHKDKGTLDAEETLVVEQEQKVMMKMMVMQMMVRTLQMVGLHQGDVIVPLVI